MGSDIVRLLHPLSILEILLCLHQAVRFLQLHRGQHEQKDNQQRRVQEQRHWVGMKQLSFTDDEIQHFLKKFSPKETVEFVRTCRWKTNQQNDSWTVDLTVENLLDEPYFDLPGTATCYAIWRNLSTLDKISATHFDSPHFECA